MTALRNIILLAAFLVAMFVIFTTLSQEEPTEQTKLFLHKLEQNDSNGLLTQFGDNTCNCQPRGGYIAYLLYRSGEQNNLSALLGQSFTAGQPAVKYVPTKSKYKGGNLPWEQPESTEIDIPIQFNQKEQAPYFLPLDMAFGHEIKEADFNEFCQHPEQGFEKSLALRLRPTVKSGLIPPPAAKPDPKRKPEYTADVFMELLPKDKSRYLRPMDAASVKLTSGKTLPAEAFAGKLPRLKAANLKFLVGRRSKYKRWAIGKVFLRDPELELSDGKILKLKSPEWQGDMGGNTLPLADGKGSNQQK